MSSSQLLLCAENFWNNVQFRFRHTVTASSEATGYTVDRLANGRRHAGDRFQSNNTNTDVTWTSRCDVLRGADFFALDRAGNHQGYRYQLLNSGDNFTTSRTLVDVNVIPTVVGGRPDGAYGCVTDEGAWLKTFTADAAYDWRGVSKAMGAGLSPQITGAWIGKAFQPSYLKATGAQGQILHYPLAEEAYAITFDGDTVSPFGWHGTGVVGSPRTGVLTIRCIDESDLLPLRRTVLELYGLRKFPMWICWQKTDAPWRAMLAEFPGGELSLRISEDWPLWYSIDIPFRESQPAVNG